MPSKKGKERGDKNEIPLSKISTSKKMVPGKVKPLTEEGKKIHGQKTKIGFTDWIYINDLRIIMYAMTAIFIFCLLTADNHRVKNIFLDGFKTCEITMVDEIQSDYSTSLTNFFALPYKEMRVKVAINRRNDICLTYSGLFKYKNEWFSAKEKIGKIGNFQKITTLKLDEEKKWLIITIGPDWKWLIIFCVICAFFAWLIPELFYFPYSNDRFLSDEDYYRKHKKTW